MNSGSFILGPVVGAALYAAFPLPAVLLSDLVGAAAVSYTHLDVYKRQAYDR